jgi:hypothetical protein
LSDDDHYLDEDAGDLAGSTFALLNGGHVLVTTRGALEDATSGFKYLPLLTRLASRHVRAHIGFGVGRSAAEAEALARHALGRCRTIGPFSAVVSFGGSDDVVLIEDDAAQDAPPGPVPMALAARRSGLSRRTLERIQALVVAKADDITTNDVATALNIEPRTARRTLKRLERAGVAQATGRMSTGTAGRPAVLFRIRL